MAFCRNCGNQIHDEAVICPQCGVEQKNIIVLQDRGGFLWGLLGCFVPVAGLVLYLIWRDTKPKTAKAAGIGALVSVGLGILYFILVFGLAILVSFYGVGHSI